MRRAKITHIRDAADEEIEAPDGRKVLVPAFLASAYRFAVANGWAGMAANAENTTIAGDSIRRHTRAVTVKDKDAVLAMVKHHTRGTADAPEVDRFMRRYGAYGLGRDGWVRGDAAPVDPGVAAYARAFDQQAGLAETVEVESPSKRKVQVPEWAADVLAQALEAGFEPSPKASDELVEVEHPEGGPAKVPAFIAEAMEFLIKNAAETEEIEQYAADNGIDADELRAVVRRLGGVR